MRRYKHEKKSICQEGNGCCTGGCAERRHGSGSPCRRGKSVAIDKKAFDELIASGITADDADIEASEWASAVKDAGVLRVGGTRTSFLFSQLDETDNGIRGFDAGLYQLLAKYILGDESAFQLEQVDSSTRESVLQSDQVDAVFATYSITDARKELISFAGPYYTSRQAILVKAGNEEIAGVDDLCRSSRMTSRHVLLWSRAVSMHM